jgi:hypothetical protein
MSISALHLTAVLLRFCSGREEAGAAAREGGRLARDGSSANKKQF